MIFLWIYSFTTIHHVYKWAKKNIMSSAAKLKTIELKKSEVNDECFKYLLGICHMVWFVNHIVFNTWSEWFIVGVVLIGTSFGLLI